MLTRKVFHHLHDQVAGTISAIFSTPVDVVKTRLMNQAGGRKDVHNYKGVIDCFINMPKHEGLGKSVHTLSPP